MASGNSSSRSVAPPDPRVRAMCSYGGKIGLYLPHGSQFSYVGGINKMVMLERDISYADVIPRLSNLFHLPITDDRVLKYRLPGLGLDVLISVTNDEDLEFMMREYDDDAFRQLFRLFLDPPEVVMPGDPAEVEMPRAGSLPVWAPMDYVPSMILPRPVAAPLQISAMNTGATLAQLANLVPAPSLPLGPSLLDQLQRLEISDDDKNKNKNVQMSGRDEATSEEHVQDLSLPAATPGPTSAIDTAATLTPAAVQAKAGEKEDAPESS